MWQGLANIYNSGLAPLEHHWDRTEKKLWSNCVSVKLMSFKEWEHVIRVIVKKSRIGSEKLDLVNQEYHLLRHHLWDIVPLQAFVSEKCTEWSDRQLVTAVCTPVTIAYDVFEGDNFEFLKKELINNHDLQNDVDLFICWYQALAKSWFIVDLFWDENLVVTREGRLKYIDSFIIDMSWRKSLRAMSEERFEKIKQLWTLPWFKK